MPSLPFPIIGALVLTFLFARLWISRGRLSLLAILLLICAVQSVIIALAQHYAVPGMRFVQPVFAAIIPPFAWFTYQVSFVRPTRIGDAIHALVPACAFAALVTGPHFLDVFIPAVFVGYGAAILLHCLRGPDAQPRTTLGSADMPARIWIVIGAVLIGSAFSDVLIVVARASGFDHWQPWIISLFSIGNMIIIGLFSLSGHLETEDDQTPPSDATQNAEPDAHVWEAVQSFMADKEPFLDPDLTLAKLSRKLGIPAKTVSTAINRATGENVSRYVNNARIETAQSMLLKGENVTSAMLACGFNTKSNFNREFLRVTGSSPSAWLSDHA